MDAWSHRALRMRKPAFPHLRKNYKNNLTSINILPKGKLIDVCMIACSLSINLSQRSIVKNLCIVSTTLLLSACTSVPPYKEPPPDQASATLTIALGNDYGQSSISYGRADANGCLEFPPLLSTGSVRTYTPTGPAPKDVKIPADGPQILRYHREIGRNASAQACTIDLRFVPKKDAHYVVTSNTRYESTKSPSLWSGETTTSKEICMVYLLEMDETTGLKPVPIKQINVNPARLFGPSCAKVAAN